MKLGSLLQSAGVRRFVGLEDQAVDSIHYDSRTVRPGGLFVAIKGHSRDGNSYIEEAIKKGAAAILTEEEWSGPRSVSMALVEDSRMALAAVSSAFYGAPSRGLCMIGITGTNGKTTTTYLIESILNAAGFTVGVIGTINCRYAGRSIASSVTTPESADLMRVLRDMLDSGTTHVVLEVSSHGIDLHRAAFCEFDVGVFTNLSRDHLDFHGDMETYWRCKRGLFTGLLGGGSKKGAGTAVVNHDDPRGKELCREISARCLRVGFSGDCDIRAENVRLGTDGTSGTVRMRDGGFDFASAMVGRHNVYNILCAAGVAAALGIGPDETARGIEGLRGVPGRLERVPNDLGVSVFVDYAHTPDALENVVSLMKGLTPGRVITIFGCGGDRDREKRPMMGEVAGRYSDLVVLTSDNPRSEAPEAILSDIVEGTVMHLGHRYEPDELADRFETAGYVVEADRRRAVALGIAAARPGDTVIIAGKGHETYQIIGDNRLPFDDRVEAAGVLKGMSAGRSGIRDRYGANDK